VIRATGLGVTRSGTSGSVPWRGVSASASASGRGNGFGQLEAAAEKMRERAKGEKPANGAGSFRPPGISQRCRGQEERRRRGKRAAGGGARELWLVWELWTDRCGVEWNGLWSGLGWASGGLCLLLGRVKSRE